MEQIIEGGTSYNEAFSLKSLIGIRVLSGEGFIVGKVSQVKIHPKTLKLEGIIIRNGLFFQRVYLDSKYIEKVSPESIILSIEPSYLLKGKKVLSNDGKFMGHVKEVIRHNQTNRIKKIVIKQFLRKSFAISPNDVKSMGYSIILRYDHDTKKTRKEKANR